MSRKSERPTGNGIAVDRVESGRDSYVVGSNETHVQVHVADGGTFEFPGLPTGGKDADRRPSALRFRRLLGLGVVCCLSLVTVAMVLSRPAPQADVEMDLRVDELGFELASTIDLLADLRLDEVMAADLDRLEIPAIEGQPRHVMTADDQGPLSALLSRHQDQAAAPLILNPSWLEPGSRLSLRHLGRQRFQLRLQAPDDAGAEDAIPTAAVRIDVTFTGPVRVRGVQGASGDGVDRVMDSVGNIGLSGQGRLELEMTFIELTGGELKQDVQVADLDFSRIEEIQTDAELSHRRVSTILDGELTTAAGVRELERGELLRWTSFTGHVRSMRLTGEGLIVRVRGEVTGLSAEIPGGSKRDLMPKVFEQLFFGSRVTS